ncbi:hypothetical protein J2787_002707 [Chryseobacterium rhizosphaerae]|uniref:Alpha/beta hydrolase n=1 Tax=Chryseobacterium rhizosphaerae TaxID=395937 RepID=A0AAE4C548_9FLAO|nr:hypothetical protein [Chryseobacterium rhizosphaerae]MDR6527315.1 hypothetical protein [Chryseobacterium rhizosphaerae]
MIENNRLCIEQLNTLKAQGKPFEYTLFSKLGHDTSSSNDTAPVDTAVQWIQQKALNSKKSKFSK